jgi:hypothetical protein
MRREEFEETLISLFRFTQLSGVAVCEGAYVSLAERTNFSSSEDVTVAAAAKGQFFLCRSPFGLLTRRTDLDEVVGEWQLTD